MPLFRRNSKAKRDDSDSSTSQSVTADEAISMRGGRRFRDDVPYLLPKDLGEINRLDLQHHILHQMLKGNYIAPISEPKMILDVGSGTGRWAYEMCKEFPDAKVTGMDLEEMESKQERPANYQFVIGNVLQDLPFEDNLFDFVHQRFLVAAIKSALWPHVIHELVRVTKPGGWLEMVEGGLTLVRGGPTYYEVMDTVRPMVERGGMSISPDPPALDTYLSEAGVVNMKITSLEVPVGNWGGKVGGLISADVRSAMEPLKNLYASLTETAFKDFDEKLEKIVVEWEEYHTVYSVKMVYGQKPA